MVTTIIIDRVGNTNVFNIVRDNLVSSPLFEGENGLQSITDPDLISEYLEELSRISGLARNLAGAMPLRSESADRLFEHLDLSGRLSEVGYAIFRQFFPESMQEFLYTTDDEDLFFYVDPSVAAIPLELLHDGKKFLWQRFRIGKGIKGRTGSMHTTKPRTRIRMLIVADPTEDLEWARVEGESLFEFIQTRFPNKEVHVELLGGRNISKLSLLRALKDKDIVHYAGHLHFSDTPGENGWVLFGDKIFHAREIQKADTTPSLLFSNACLSGHGGNRDWSSRFAACFLGSQASAYIGTVWELPDTRPTIEFTKKLYEFLFQGRSMGDALQGARNHIRDTQSLNDLTWASYLLLGNPAGRIFDSNRSIPDVSALILDYEEATRSFPAPIAYALRKCTGMNPAEIRKVIHCMFDVSEAIIFWLGAIVTANYRWLRLPSPLRFAWPDARQVLDDIFSQLNSINAIKAKLVISNLLEILLAHRDDLYRLALRADQYRRGEVGPDDLDSLQVSVQYAVENIMLDLDVLYNTGFYYVGDAGIRQLRLCGVTENHVIREITLPTQTDMESRDEIAEKLEPYKGKVILFHPIRKTLLDLSPFIRLDFHGPAGSYNIHFISEADVEPALGSEAQSQSSTNRI